MKLFSHLSIIRGIGYLLVLIFCVNCKKDFNSADPSQLPAESISGAGSDNLAESGFLSQTRTATFLNNLNNFQQVFGNLNYPRARAVDVSANDNICTCSSKLIAIKDSASSFTSNSVSTLALQGFGFTIPDDATIENIVVKVRRFKKGSPSVGDHILSVIQRFQSGPGQPSRYGVMWTYADDEELEYPGRIYPASETEYLFFQSGSGNNGGINHTQAYQWTPAIVNHQYFGVRIDNYPPIGKGSVQICYDLVDITVEYSLPEVAPQ
jgi:hypothetical protein